MLITKCHYPLDVDECSSNPCSQECANVYGSYQCYCRRGYQLSDVDGITCEGKILSCKMGGRFREAFLENSGRKFFRTLPRFLCPPLISWHNFSFSTGLIEPQLSCIPLVETPQNIGVEFPQTIWFTSSSNPYGVSIPNHPLPCIFGYPDLNAFTNVVGQLLFAACSNIVLRLVTTVTST